MILGEPEGSVLGPSLFIIYNSGLVQIIGNNIVGYVDDTKIHTVISKQISGS